MAMFRSVDHAIKFSYAIAEYPIMPKSTLAKMLTDEFQTRSILPVGAMTDHDWHAQGSLIRSRCERLPQPLGAYVLAFYSWGIGRALGIRTLAKYVGTQINTTLDDETMCALVLRYCDRGRGRRSSLATIGKQHDTPWQTLEYWEHKAIDEMAYIDARLEQLLGDEWSLSGLIEQNNSCVIQ